MGDEFTWVFRQERISLDRAALFDRNGELRAHQLGVKTQPWETQKEGRQDFGQVMRHELGFAVVCGKRGADLFRTADELLDVWGIDD